jgi:hypothetical protein
MPVSMIREFLKLEAAGGIVLVLAAVLALILANTPLITYYTAFIETPVAVRVGALEIAKPLLLWVNDGLMAVFFFLVGLEIKREFLEGELSSRAQVTLPALGAVGGMAVPALVYVVLNWGNAQNLYGWAIPAATDIAFALGILALIGSRAPLALKVLLTAIAIIDDLGAILIIAVFYTEDLSVFALLLSIVPMVGSGFASSNPGCTPPWPACSQPWPSRSNRRAKVRSRCSGRSSTRSTPGSPSASCRSSPSPTPGSPSPASASTTSSSRSSSASRWACSSASRWASSA